MNFHFNSENIKLIKEGDSGWLLNSQSQAQKEAKKPRTSTRRRFFRIEFEYTDLNGNGTIANLRKMLDKIGDEKAHISMRPTLDDKIALSITSIEDRKATKTELESEAYKERKAQRRKETLLQDLELEMTQLLELGDILQEDLKEAMNPKVGIINSDYVHKVLSDLSNLEARRKEVEDLIKVEKDK